MQIMKITEIPLAPPTKIGKLNKPEGARLEPYEESTMKLLTLYGFSMDVILPSNTPKINNPDTLIDGTLWEIKTPLTYNKNKLENRMRKASKQANRVVFDLSNIKKDYTKAEKCVIKLFESIPGIRRMILITKDKKLLDYRKK